MTEQAFCERYSVSRRKLKTWLKKGWIPGARPQEDGACYIPNAAIPPYACARARGGVNLYRSIIAGCVKGRAVFPELYHMPPEHFWVYIDELKKAGLIRVETVEGVRYCYPTPLGCDAEKWPNARLADRLRQAKPYVQSAGAIATAALNLGQAAELLLR